MFLRDPAAALAPASELVLPGGLVCFHEGDRAYDWAAPMTSLWTRVRACVLETFRRARLNPRMGLQLHARFVAAGLPSPERRMECAPSANFPRRSPPQAVSTPDHGPNLGCCADEAAARLVRRHRDHIMCSSCNHFLEG
jgi:hypothetical protein